MHENDLQRAIHEIGRGPRGARDLPRDEARRLWDAILDERLAQAAIGAALMAMRLKGESLDELCALRDAVHERLEDVTGPAPMVCMPCYNGARRVPNLSWLTALALRRAGYAVLMHGVRRDEGRLATCEVVQAAGAVVAESVETARHTLADDRIVFLPIDAWCPPLARMLALRAQIGVRNSGHSVAKWLRPDPRALLLVPATHSEYLETAIAVLSGDAGPALVFRGVDGEPALYPHAARTVHALVPRSGADAGLAEAVLRPSVLQGERDAAVVPPAEAGAREIAAWSDAVIRGDLRMPSMIDALVAQALDACAAVRPCGDMPAGAA